MSQRRTHHHQELVRTVEVVIINANVAHSANGIEAGVEDITRNSATLSSTCKSKARRRRAREAQSLSNAATLRTPVDDGTSRAVRVYLQRRTMNNECFERAPNLGRSTSSLRWLRTSREEVAVDELEITEDSDLCLAVVQEPRLNDNGDMAVG
ncbi:hypothetical protein BC629DRAFT_1434095 [Irpex lacteus]|nr:hypothetical protein BC629DRAFT_1434095 [Irpex lacteus]